jgi:hypothetical protein
MKIALFVQAILIGQWAYRALINYEKSKLETELSNFRIAMDIGIQNGLQLALKA